MIDFKSSQFERDIILWGVRWYVAYPISYRQLEEMMAERGVEVDHSSLNRLVLKYTPLLELNEVMGWTRPSFFEGNVRCAVGIELRRHSQLSGFRFNINRRAAPELSI